ncbi:MULTISPECIES: MBOAT family O-acyltransferase [Fusobacterium]|uniref:MBOAT family O-acyltransferase n=1 Tax=Fusobacterium TaxID=848 RepID=UPI0025C37206|nr:MBOAT family O-acyltransferase [Fusobacterium sp.]MCI7223516.1 MBOAT family protein [Fusobacterium sp.]MDD7409795.1 MBOAT family protein [Fusobacteriaceae bacterium]MDY5712917.1 MBOAT family O-acyltransferase [Fusobacterium gastrosuis]
MIFSSLIFLSVFFPIVFVCYYISKKSLRNYILLLASLIFYAWGEPKYLAIMLLVILLNYLFALFLENTKRNLILYISIFVNLGILFYFKYYNFVIENLNKTEFFSFSMIKVTMPIGISFFIFQGLSYVLDVYKGEVKAQKDIYKLTLYISFFPQLIAGPIVKYHDIQKEIDYREEKFENIYNGFLRFTFGLGKKVILANTLGKIVDEIFLLDFNFIDYKIAWLAAISYSLQLYFDFSGYSDMAIGLGKIFGFHFLENFNYPYLSKSITEFWRRWHISLGSWFREYLYIPLGGNKVSLLRNCFNLLIVFLATGIWHGANWTFIIWGLWHGIFILIEKAIKIEKYIKKYQIIFRHLYTIIIFVVGWVLFRAENISDAINFIKIMFGFSNNNNIAYGILYFLNLKNIFIIIISILSAYGLFKINYRKDRNYINTLSLNLLSLLVLTFSLILILGDTYNPFIYFRF